MPFLQILLPLTMPPKEPEIDPVLRYRMKVRENVAEAQKYAFRSSDSGLSRVKDSWLRVASLGSLESTAVLSTACVGTLAGLLINKKTPSLSPWRSIFKVGLFPFYATSLTLTSLAYRNDVNPFDTCVSFAIPALILRWKAPPAILARTILMFGTTGLLAGTFAKIAMNAKMIGSIDELRFMFKSSKRGEHDFMTFLEAKELFLSEKQQQPPQPRQD